MIPMVHRIEIFSRNPSKSRISPKMSNGVSFVDRTHQGGVVGGQQLRCPPSPNLNPPEPNNDTQSSAGH
jgi:hypothetical protein